MRSKNINANVNWKESSQSILNRLKRKYSRIPNMIWIRLKTIIFAILDGFIIQNLNEVILMSVKTYVLIFILTIIGIISIGYFGAHNPVETVTEEVIDAVEHNPQGTTDLSKIAEQIEGKK